MANPETKKTILVTGGAGFIGSNLIKRLVAEGHTVISLDNYFTGSEINHVPEVDYRFGHTKNIEALVPEAPALIYHLGEYSRVEQSVFEPELVHDLNTVGTRAVLEFWRKRGSKLIYAGSSTKFGDGGLARDTSPYAFTKAANTELVKEYAEKYKMPYAITYFYNVFGPRERSGIYGTVIEIFKQQYLRGTPLTVTSPGSQIRNFTHVDDIVDGLMVIAEKGEGDEYGLGNDQGFSIIDVARLFKTNVVMLPERQGNRMQSALVTTKTAELGWRPTRRLEEYVQNFVTNNKPGSHKEKRVLVFSTTFFPVQGPAEEALCALMGSMPDIHFEIITTRYTQGAAKAECPVQNAAVHRVGIGLPIDKYLLPVLGSYRAWALSRRHSYFFIWSLMASYAALAAIFFKRVSRLPLLITLADQDVFEMSRFKQFLLRIILTDADQVYGTHENQEHDARRVTSRRWLRHSIGEGDAFANQLRFVYSGFVKKFARSAR